jgi:enoyl-CoA hydratase/carnithine racemase
VIRFEDRPHGIALITIDRPAARNAMTLAMWDTLRDAALALDRRDDVRAVVITGAGGRAFVSGTDIAEFTGFAGPEDGIAYEARIEAVIAALEALRVPAIAAISGACTGGGVSIAAACDVRIGGPGTRVGVPIARTLGNCISLRNLARLAAVIGLDAAKAHRPARRRRRGASPWFSSRTGTRRRWRSPAGAARRRRDRSARAADAPCHQGHGAPHPRGDAAA